MFDFPPILAAFGVDDFVQIAIILIVVISALANQFAKARRKNVQRPRQRPAAQHQPPVQAAGPDAVQNEIENFLRRAAGHRGQQQPAEVEVVKPPPPRPPARPPLATAPVVEAIAVEAEIVPDPAPQRLGRGVTEHVREHLQTGGVEDRDAHLGERVEHADDLLESRLHSVFDHRLGRLQDTTVGVEEEEVSEGTDAAIWGDVGEGPSQTDLAAGAMAPDLFAMLNSTEDLRKAIVLTEVFRRPDDDW